MQERDDYDPSGRYPMPSRTRIHGLISYLSENVSRMFLIAGLLIVLTLPFFRNDLSKFLLPFSVLSVVLLVFLAAFTSKKYRWTVVVDALVSMCGLIIFSFRSIDIYTNYGVVFFGINLLLTVIFLMSFYLSVRIIRDWLNGAK